MLYISQPWLQSALVTVNLGYCQPWLLSALVTVSLGCSQCCSSQSWLVSLSPVSVDPVSVAAVSLGYSQPWLQ